jgi:cytochrome c oxidase subunit 2
MHAPEQGPFSSVAERDLSRRDWRGKGPFHFIKGRAPMAAAVERAVRKMRASSMKRLKLATGLSSAVMAGAFAAQAWAADKLGQPTNGAIDFQPSAAPLRDQVMFFHNDILLPIVTAIVALVAVLLLICIVRFNKRSNPTPARFSHNTVVEVVWTVVPVLILMGIAIFSFKLLYAFHDMPKPDVTLKATGNQWYWSYEYPDLKVAEYTSKVLPEADAKAKGLPYRLASDNPIVVPVNKNVRVLVSGADVIHSWTVPAFGVKIDAIPGRVNQTWFKAKQTGTYYGQCSELCGVDHAFMPIEVKVVTQPEFDAWVASKKTAKPAPTPTANAAAGAATAPAPAAPAPTSHENPAAPAAANTPAPPAPATH